MAVRKFPTVDPRVETGPVQFGEDYTGIFVRGDVAAGMAADLEAAAHWIRRQRKGPVLFPARLLGYAKFLRECHDTKAEPEAPDASDVA